MRLHSQPPIPPALPDTGGKEPIVPRRDEMDRHAHEGPLNDRSAFQGAVEVVALETLEPRPEANVHGWRVLCLQPPHLLEGSGKTHPLPLKQELAGEQRAIKLALGQGQQRESAAAARGSSTPSRFGSLEQVSERG